MSSITDSWKSAQKLFVPLAVAGAVTLVVAAIAIPNLYRVRMPAREAEPLQELGGVESSTGTLEMRDRQQISLPSAGPMAAQLKASPTSLTKAPSATADRKIVRTGSLALIVKSPADGAEQIRVMAENMGGYLESAQIGGTKEAPTADLTIRVPAVRFEEAKAQIRQLAARVDSEKTDAQDVTRQYVDMEARLRNLRAEEAQYLTILKSAFKVEDLLEVTQKLSEVRGQIEQQQAEFQTLWKQVETVAITVSLRALADAEVFGLNWRPLYQLKIAARNGLDAIADYASTMAAILFYVPVVFAWSLTLLSVAVGGWRLWRWIGRRFFEWPPVAAPSPKAAESI